MGSVTKNISVSELICRCGRCNVRIQNHEPIIQIVQLTCDHFAMRYGVDRVRLDILSPARCHEYNRSDAVGSNDESQHPRCGAMDVRLSLPGGALIPPREVYDYLDEVYPDSLGLGLYEADRFTHVDDRPTRHRWGF